MLLSYNSHLPDKDSTEINIDRNPFPTTESVIGATVRWSRSLCLSILSTERASVRYFVRKGVLRNFAKIYRKTPVPESLLK